MAFKADQERWQLHNKEAESLKRQFCLVDEETLEGGEEKFCELEVEGVRHLRRRAKRVWKSGD